MDTEGKQECEQQWKRLIYYFIRLHLPLPSEQEVEEGHWLSSGRLYIDCMRCIQIPLAFFFLITTGLIFLSEWFGGVGNNK